MLILIQQLCWMYKLGVVHGNWIDLTWID